MDISEIFLAATNNNVNCQYMKNVFSNTDNYQFQSYIDDLQMKADIIEHLNGVPSEVVYIAPNILEKMKENPSTYKFYMEQLDYFVGEYKKNNQPGVMEMSFFINEDGQYGIRAENMYLKRLCEGADGIDQTVENSKKIFNQILGIESYSQISDNSILSLYLSGAYAVDKERIKFFDMVKSD